MSGCLKRSCSGFNLKSVTGDCLSEFNTYRIYPITLLGILSLLCECISTGLNTYRGAKALTFAAFILAYFLFLCIGWELCELHMLLLPLMLGILNTVKTAWLRCLRSNFMTVFSRFCWICRRCVSITSFISRFLASRCRRLCFSCLFQTSFSCSLISMSASSSSCFFLCSSSDKYCQYLSWSAQKSA